MTRVFALLLLIMLLAVPSILAQDRKIEVSPFAGGYFSAGFQSVQVITITTPGTTIASREFRPIKEPNSGIFGARASYDLSRRFSVEGTFGFSPAGRSGFPSGGVGSFVFTNLTDFLTVPPSGVLAIPFPARGKDTFHYAGNALFHWRKANDWAPFLTGGLGAIHRTGKIVLPSAPVSARVVPVLNPSPVGGRPSFVLPALSPDETDFSVNFGGGIKKYFRERYGIRLDFRDYVSTVGDDTVNNIEVSLGLIFKL